eukprot:jgi/Mesen1/8995/ME000056S08400
MRMLKLPSKDKLVGRLNDKDKEGSPRSPQSPACSPHDRTSYLNYGNSSPLGYVKKETSPGPAGSMKNEQTSSPRSPASFPDPSRNPSISSLSPIRRTLSGTEYCHTVSILREAYSDIREKYMLGPELGQGQSGIIRTCRHKATGAKLACKTIVKSKLRVKDVEDLQIEVAALKSLEGHPGVVGLKETFEDSQYVHIIMELCEGGDLYTRIQRCQKYEECEAARVIAAITDVIGSCHRRGILHRDLKPENILMTSKHSNTSIRVADFGVAAFIKPGQHLSSMIGSAYYVAPEVLKGSYSLEADVWSIGVILYILLCGVPPFWAKDNAGIFKAILAGSFDMDWGPWKTVSGGAKDLIRKMLTMDPARRFRPRDVLGHPWIVEMAQVKRTTEPAHDRERTRSCSALPCPLSSLNVESPTAECTKAEQHSRIHRQTSCSSVPPPVNTKHLQLDEASRKDCRLLNSHSGHSGAASQPSSPMQSTYRDSHGMERRNTTSTFVPSPLSSKSCTEPLERENRPERSTNTVSSVLGVRRSILKPTSSFGTS